MDIVQIISLITAIAGFVGIIWKLVRDSRGIKDNFSSLKEYSGNEFSKQFLQSRELRREHGEILASQKDLLSKQQDVIVKSEKIYDTLEYQRREEQARLSSLTHSQRQIADAVKDLELFSKEFQDLALTNVHLMEQIHHLEQENQQLKVSIKRMQNELNYYQSKDRTRGDDFERSL